MARREFLGSVVETTTTGSLNSTDTSISLTDGSTFPTGSANPFVIVIDRGTGSEEKILITSRTSNTLTVSQRGYDGTTATTHSSGANVDHVLDATSIQDMNTSINDVTDVITADTANDRVGIGTTSPDVPLDISGSSSTQFIGSRIINTNTTSGAEAVLKFEVLDQEGHIGLERPEPDVGADMYFSTTDAGASSPFAPTERMRITQDGKVGIGTASPSAELDVVGEIESTTLRLTSTVDATNTSTGHAFQIGNAGGGHLQIDDNGVQRRTTGGTTSSLHLQKNGGQVRIGDTTDADV